MCEKGQVGRAQVSREPGESSVAAITARARERGMTLKQVVCHALAEAGVRMADADLEGRTPRRRG